MAADAVLVEHRLDLAREAEAARRAVPGRDVAGRAVSGERQLGGGAGVAVLVAADARDDLARHGGEPAPHQLQGLALGVQRLHGDRRVGRHAEQGRAVGLDRHGAEDPLDVPRAVHADHALRAAHARIEEVVGEEAQLLDRAARDALPAPRRRRCRTGTRRRPCGARSTWSGMTGGRRRGSEAEPARTARSPGLCRAGPCCRTRRPGRCPTRTGAVGWAATRKYLSLSG